MKTIGDSIKGFSVAGLMVAAGLMAGLSLLLSQLSLQQMGIQRKAETGVEIVQASERISRLLQNNTACMNTLKQGGTVNVNLLGNLSGFSLTAIRDKKNNSVLLPATPYLNGLLKPLSINVSNVDVSGGVGRLDVVIVFEKTSQAIQGYKQVTKTFPLAVELDVGGNVLRCSSDIEAAIAEAKSQLCAELGGIFNTSTQKCKSRLANRRCASGEILQGFNASTGALTCTAAASLPHPAGFNCYRLTSHQWVGYQAASMGTPGFPFKEIVALDQEEGLWRWELEPSGSCAGPPSYCPALNSINTSSCAPGYTARFYRAMWHVTVAGNVLWDHYCCR